MDHEVRVAYDGAQALHVAQIWRPDVVLLDLGMPGLSGYDTCRRIREATWSRGMTLKSNTGPSAERSR